MNIVITGCDGQLGSSLKSELIIEKNFKFYFFNKKELDITDQKNLEIVINKVKPSIFINCSAFTNVNLAENNISDCLKVNVKGPKFISKLCKLSKCTLIHFSTDYVFDGNKKIPYLENDLTKPLSVYGKSKLCAENEIINSGCNYIIFRLSWLYNPKFNQNLISKLIHNIKKSKEFYSITDEISKPTCSLTFARYIDKIIKNFKNKNVKFLLHYAEKGEGISIYELANFINKSEKFKVFNTQINPVFSNKYHKIKIRPNYSVLDNSKLIKKFNINLDSWRNILNFNIKEFY